MRRGFSRAEQRHITHLHRKLCTKQTPNDAFYSVSSNRLIGFSAVSNANSNHHHHPPNPVLASSVAANDYTGQNCDTLYKLIPNPWQPIAHIGSNGTALHGTHGQFCFIQHRHVTLRHPLLGRLKTVIPYIRGRSTRSRLIVRTETRGSVVHGTLLQETDRKTARLALRLVKPARRSRTAGRRRSRAIVRNGTAWEC
ncbi:hypothetical protein M427DRAFT_256944 [Gonapodya prolifera JEL478]|uniref:Uncharacterized protein n=1 Tax=Gonapodya prolifera (strain JEL478) TaxID=1344416 RepID=A0A138ZXA0_GONPJ|nr:hypothetical protein M427DRAFT_256944 [Gonapodya prolifera JEL478]|eukprot:KXS09081.1 hypothetical protein M427DRAFT_256944 [Gonapodya prolifera JEL478]